MYFLRISKFSPNFRMHQEQTANFHHIKNLQTTQLKPAEIYCHNMFHMTEKIQCLEEKFFVRFEYVIERASVPEKV